MKAKFGTLSLSGIALIIGIFFLFSGIKGVIEASIISKDYETTDGYLYDYEIYSKGGYNAAKRRHTNDTYRLIYQYYADGQEYTVSTDIGVGVVPAIGSVKKIHYNPDNPSEAFISGPDSNAFKIFFGLFFIAIPSFFIWIFIPEKKKTKKKPRETSIDTFGAILGFVFLFFSYGILFFITGEFSIAGIVNFYRTSFILPMIIPILLFTAGGYLFIKSIFGSHKKLARVCMIAGICILAIMVGAALLDSNVKPPAKRITKKVDFSDVHTFLSERGFETANIPTTYWFHDESKLTNVVSGIKDDTAFEFYEYTDGKTTDGVYNSISYDISQDMEQAERVKYETKLPDGGKIFNLTEDGIHSVVLYKGNIVIYAHSPEGQNEILDILSELGFEVFTTDAPHNTEEIRKNSKEDTEEPVITEVNWENYFDGMNGSAVIYSPSENSYQIYNQETALTQHSPCSTFKIISSLIGLEHEVIVPDDSPRTWSGEIFWNENWNRNINFEDAFRTSCVWYYREIIDELGKDVVQEELNRLSYGNCDISDWEGLLNTNSNNRALTGFWIESSLKISPKEQVEVLERIFGEPSIYSQDTQNILKQVMFLSEQPCPDTLIYGKTGLGKSNGRTDAWFTGFADTTRGRKYFCIYLGDAEGKNVSSAKAKEIAMELISNLERF